MRFLSLFSGIDAASRAWLPLGWEAVGFAEIEPMPCSYLAHHYPGVPNLGDVSKITDADIAALGQIDIVIGGSPCQGMSVAGKGAGLADPRSGLFHQQMRIFHAARHFCGARWLVWENVPGAFSTNQGRDFAVVVAEMAGCRVDVPADGWGTEGVALGESGLVEWAVLDAQWFGVPQRRRRVFAVLDSGNWRGRPPVLLERDSLRGDHPPRREAGQNIAGTLGARTRGGGGLGTDFELDGGLICANAEGSTGLPFLTSSNIGKCVNNQTPLIAHAKTYGVYGGNKRADRPEGGFYVREESTSRTLDAGDVAMFDGWRVRRLTPRECERLQGYPDDATLVPHKGKPAADTPRYRALGNGMAVPVIAWIGKQIDNAVRYAD